MTELAEIPSTILIAGCGYAGFRAAKFWQQSGAQVTAITRSATRAQEFAAVGLRPLVLDITDAAAWPALPAAELVVWSVGYDRTAGKSREAVWLDGLQRFLQRLPEAPNPRRILLTSSTSVYGDCGGSEVDENTPPEPEQEGGRTCLAAERMLGEYAVAEGAAAVVLRLAGIYGPGRLLRRLDDLRAGVPIPADPDSWLNLVHVDDITRTLDFCARHPQPPRLLNVAAAVTATRRTYYQTLAELAGVASPQFSPPAAGGTGRGGNRRVVSPERQRLRLQFLYEDCRAGLLQSLGLTSSPGQPTPN
jgi:nucleoside-diphosphate-sugar epimerase